MKDVSCPLSATAVEAALARMNVEKRCIADAENESIVR
jgi:hypothetical protein